MPDPVPPSVQIARLVVGALVALAVVAASTFALSRHDLSAEAYAALVTLAAAGGAYAHAASSRRRRPGDEGTTYAPPRADDDRAKGGYVRVPRVLRRGLRWLLVALACAGIVVLEGCPLPPPDGCTPLATRCSPEGVPQSCSPSQRWTSGALQRPCAQRAAGSACCRARSPYGTDLYACVPAGACLPDTSADAGAEGGEQ